MIINVTYDSSVTSSSNAASIEAAISAAVQFYQTNLTNSMTVNIAFGFGEVGGSSMGTGPLGESSSYGNYESYATLRQALINHATSADDKSSTAALAASDPTGGGQFFVTTAMQKALGQISANSAAIDGYVGLTSSYPLTFDPNNRAVAGDYDAVGILEHEISEVLGRIGGTNYQGGGYAPMDLFRYTSSGARETTWAANTAGYFSVDGGKTTLTKFNDPSNGGDAADWDSSVPGDSYGYGYKGMAAVVNATDLRCMDVLGYTLASSGPSSYTAAQAIAAYGANSGISALSVVDTAANISGNLDVLQTLAGNAKLATVTVSDAPGPLTLTASQLTSDAGVLAAIAGTVGLTVANGASAFSYTLAGNVNSVSVSGSGAATLVGNGVTDTMNGGSGDDIFVAGLGLAAMAGGAGNDTYYVNSASDVVNESNGNGFDTVVSGAASFTLAANVEALVLSGNGRSGTASSQGSILEALGTGDTLVGGIGNDVFDFGLSDFISGTTETINNLGWATAGYGSDRIHLEGIAASAVSVSSAGGKTDIRIGLAGGTHSDIIINGTNGTPLQIEFLGTITAQSGLSALTAQPLANETTVSYDVAGTQSWSSIADTYDTNGVKSLETTYNDNGTTLITNYNTSASGGWSYYTTTYGTAGMPASQIGYNKDGSSWTYSYDSQGRLGASNTYTAAGALVNYANYDTFNQYAYTNYTYTYVNNVVTQQVGTYDTGMNWSYGYDSQGRLTFSDVFTGGGLITVYSAYDPGNQFTYSTYSNTYNAAGTIIQQVGTYDDGSGWSYGYDSQSQLTFSDLFTAAGVVTKYTAYDPSNQYNYSSYTNTYAASGTLASQSGSYDAGGTWTNSYDSQGRETTADIFAAGGALSSHTVFDAASQFNWSYYANSYDGTGKLTQTLTVFDDGTKQTVTF